MHATTRNGKCAEMACGPLESPKCLAQEVEKNSDFSTVLGLILCHAVTGTGGSLVSSGAMCFD